MSVKLSVNNFHRGNFAFSYILKVPFDKEDRSGIVYVWVGTRADPEEARITEEIAREMYDGVRRTLNYLILPFCSQLPRNSAS